MGGSKRMIRVANTSAAISCAAGLAAWLQPLELYIRIAGGLVALAAGILTIVIHVRTLRKGKK